jgi:hypothetical protein
VRAAATVLVLGLAACNTPHSVCEDYQHAVNRMYARCDVPIRLEFYWASGPHAGEPATCDDVTNVENADAVLCDCIPWTEDVSCDSLAADSYALHRSCDDTAFTFTYYE